MALLEFKSQLIADVGVSMGDEGKGRVIYEIIDELKDFTKDPSVVEMVMKVNGGANSGHTAGGLKLNLLPAGVIAKDVKFLSIGAGVVADPRKFLWEALPLEKLGYNVLNRLLIDERTQVSDLTHRLLDLAWEDYRVNIAKEEPRGSTGRGITPSYMDEVGQFQTYYVDALASKEDFARKFKLKMQRALNTIRYVCNVSEERFNEYFDKLTVAEKRANAEAIESGVFEESQFDFTIFRGENYSLNEDALIDVYWNTLQKLAPCICDIREKVLNALSRGKSIVGEFGQSYWLDKRQGFSPNVTASHTYTPEFFQSAGIPAQRVHTMGCCKAYDTKVGTHTFITQMDDNDPLTKILKKLEFGTSTGRQRMVGWFDAVEKADALRFGGYDDLVINKLDALTYSGDWSGKLKVCVAYKTPDGKILKYVPRSEALRKTLEPVYELLDGWQEDISLVRSWNDLPENAKNYISFCCKKIYEIASRDEKFERNVNLRYVGVGPDTSQIIKDIPADLFYK